MLILTKQIIVLNKKKKVGDDGKVSPFRRNTISTYHQVNRQAEVEKGVEAGKKLPRKFLRLAESFGANHTRDVAFWFLEQIIDMMSHFEIPTEMI